MRRFNSNLKLNLLPNFIMKRFESGILDYKFEIPKCDDNYEEIIICDDSNCLQDFLEKVKKLISYFSGN